MDENLRKRVRNEEYDDPIDDIVHKLRVLSFEEPAEAYGLSNMMESLSFDYFPSEEREIAPNKAVPVHKTKEDTGNLIFDISGMTRQKLRLDRRLTLTDEVLPIRQRRSKAMEQILANSLSKK